MTGRFPAWSSRSPGGLSDLSLVDALVVQQSCYTAHECSIGTQDRDNEVAPDEHSKKYWAPLSLEYSCQSWRGAEGNYALTGNHCISFQIEGVSSSKKDISLVEQQNAIPKMR